MKDLISSHGFHIVNRPRDVLDFIPVGTSFIDITLTWGQVNVTRWLFLSNSSLSNHLYIYFEVKMCALPPLPRKVAPSLAGLDKIKFCCQSKTVHVQLASTALLNKLTSTIDHALMLPN